MNITAHPVAPEDLMALLDGELSGNLAESVATHLAQCNKCASLATELRETSQSLAAWTVPTIHSEMEDTVKDAASEVAYRQRAASGKIRVRSRRSYWKPVAVAAAAVFFVASLVVYRAMQRDDHEYSRFSAETRQAPDGMAAHALTSVDGARNAPLRSSSDLLATADTNSETPSAAHASTARMATLAKSAAPGSTPSGSTTPSSPSMIARTVNLTIVTRDYPAARGSLDQLLARHHGYFTTLEANSQQDYARSLNASLRIPAPELAAALTEMRALGRVFNESQSAEEVTRQHEDLAARLQTSRETEARFRSILEQRTGKLSDVLSVEESIARVRGDIERMEAEQKTLEHRVDYAKVELQLNEEYNAPLNLPDNSTATRLRNGFVAGYHNAAGTLLGIIVFCEEFGPAILIWLVILALPIILWKRYRR